MGGSKDLSSVVKSRRRGLEMKALIKCHEADVRKDFKSEDRVMKIQDVKKLNKNSGILELRLVASPGQYRFRGVQ